MITDSILARSAIVLNVISKNLNYNNDWQTISKRKTYKFMFAILYSILYQLKDLRLQLCIVMHTCHVSTWKTDLGSWV